jgi:hypothetical protein
MQDCGIWDSCQIDEDRSSAVGRQWHVLIAEVTAFLTCPRWRLSRHRVCQSVSTVARAKERAKAKARASREEGWQLSRGGQCRLGSHARQ